MNRCVSTAVAAAMLVGATATVSADSITITSDRRTTIVLANTRDVNGSDRHTDTDVSTDSLSSSASATTGTSSGTSGATLASDIGDPTRLTGAGTANVAWNAQDMADYSASSTFGITLSLTSAFNYVFNGSFDGSFMNSGTGLVAGGQSRWFATLVRDGGGILFNDSAINATGTRLFTGLLLPGVYRFVVDGSTAGYNTRDGGTGSGQMDFDFSLDLTPADVSPAPTPEPASLLLLGTGLLGLWRARRARD